MTDDTRRTLLILRRDGEILLAMKKRGFGEGLYNGVGGKLHLGETIEEAMVRETQEEINVTPLKYEKVAEFDFVQDANTDPWHMYMHTYVATEWEGEPVETEEMAPQWFPLDRIPYHKMWEDDPHWLPLVLAGEHVRGTFIFDEDNHLIEHRVEATTEWRNDDA